jgi:hypothetical protein
MITPHSPNLSSDCLLLRGLQAWVVQPSGLGLDGTIASHINDPTE